MNMKSRQNRHEVVHPLPITIAHTISTSQLHLTKITENWNNLNNLFVCAAVSQITWFQPRFSNAGKGH